MPGLAEIDRFIDARLCATPATLNVVFAQRTAECTRCAVSARESYGVDAVDVPALVATIEGLEPRALMHIIYEDERAEHAKDLLEVISIARSRGHRIELSSPFTGLPRKHIVEVAASGLERFTLTIDLRAGDLAEMIEHLELHRAGKTIAALAHAKRPDGQRLPVRLHVDVGRSVANVLDKIVALAKTLKIWDLRLRSLVDGGVDPAEHRTIRSKLQRYRDVAVDFVGFDEDAGPLEGRSGVATCVESPWSSLRMLTDGAIVTCERRSRAPLGNARDRAVNAIWRSPSYDTFRRRYLDGAIAECRACPVKVVARADVPLGNTIAPGVEGESQLMRDWFPPEGPIVWGGPSSTAVLCGNRDDGALHIVGQLPPSYRSSSNVLSVEVDGTYVGSVVNGTRSILEFDRRFPVAASLARSVNVAFRVSDVYCPKELGLGDDKRALGFVLVLLELSGT